MTNREYREKAARTLPNLGLDKETQKIEIMDKEIGHKLNLCHMILGLNGEIGELVQCVGTELKGKVDRENLKEELGDIYWYLSNYCLMRELPVPEDIKIDVPNDMCLDLLIVSIATLTDLVKRYIAYGKVIDKPKELETIYNIYSGLHLFENSYDMEGSVIRARNIAKLTVRYPEKYSDDKALNRNIEAEKKAIE